MITKRTNRIKHPFHGLKRLCLLTALAAFGLCACGVSNTKQEGKQTSSTDKITQEQKQTSDAENTEQSELQDLLWEQQYNTSKQCIYTYKLDAGSMDGESWEASSIIQKDRQGKLLSHHPMSNKDSEYIYLLCVSEQHLCYALSDEDGNHTIYAVPIEQKGGEEQLLWDENKKIAQTNERALEQAVYIVEPYLFYIQKGCLMRYDFNSGKSKQIVKGKNGIVISSTYEAVVDKGMLYVNDDYMDEDDEYVLYEEDVNDEAAAYRDPVAIPDEIGKNSIYRIAIESGKAEKIYTAKKGWHAALVKVDGDLLYMLQENIEDGDAYIECYDRGKQQTKSIIQLSELQKFLKKEKLLNSEYVLGGLQLEKLFVSEGRVYLELFLSYDYTKESLEGDSQCVDGSLVVRCPQGDLTDLSNETVLNEWLLQHTVGDWNDEAFTLCGDEFVLYYAGQDDANKDSMVRYRLQDKQLQEVEKTDSLFGQYAIVLSSYY